MEKAKILLQDDARMLLSLEDAQRVSARMVLDQFYGGISSHAHLFGGSREYVPYDKLSQLYGPLCVKPGHVKRLLELLRPLYHQLRQQAREGSGQSDMVLAYTSMGGVSISEVPSHDDRRVYASIERIILEEFKQP